MSQPGIGSMLHYLSGGSRHNPDEFYGRKITSAALDDNKLKLSFGDGTAIVLWDDGQSCCESRYITCDDDLNKIVGGELRRIEAKRTEDKADPEGWGDHEMVFIEIGTDECFVTICTHNEHNGYYGGFGLTIDTVAS